MVSKKAHKKHFSQVYQITIYDRSALKGVNYIKNLSFDSEGHMVNIVTNNFC